MSEKQVMKYLEQQNVIRGISGRLRLNPLQLECLLFIGANSKGEINWAMDSDVLFEYLTKRGGYGYSAVSRTTVELHRHGLIEKDIHPINQRKRILKLTSRGFGFYREIAAHL